MCLFWSSRLQAPDHLHALHRLNWTDSRKIQPDDASVCYRPSHLISRKGKEEMETIHFPALPQSFTMMIVLRQLESATADLWARYRPCDWTPIGDPSEFDFPNYSFCRFCYWTKIFCLWLPSDVNNLLLKGQFTQSVLTLTLALVSVLAAM